VRDGALLVVNKENMENMWFVTNEYHLVVVVFLA